MSTKSSKSNRSVKRDREKHSGKDHHGAAKGGAGGKGTWGPEDGQYDAAAVDVDDPNYEDEADQVAVDTQDLPENNILPEAEDAAPQGSRRRQRRRRAAAEPAVPTWVFAGNLGVDTTSEDLHDFFSQYGEVVEASVSKRRNRRTVNWGKINFATEEQAQAALAGGGADMNGSAIIVEIMRNAPRKRQPREPRDQEPPEPANECQLFVGNLQWRVTNENLEELFAPHGELVHAEVQTHLRKNRSRGWGIVEYTTPVAALSAIEALDNHELEGRALMVEALRNGRTKRRARKPSQAPAEPTPEREPTPIDESILFVGNLDWEATEDDVRQFFEGHDVVSVEFSKNRYSERSRRWASVEMASKEEAAVAIETLHGQELAEREIVVEVRKGTGRRKRKRRPRGRSRRSPGSENTDEVREAQPGRKRAPRKPRQKPPVRVVEQPECHLFVGNLAFAVVEEDLRAYLEPFGTVVNLEIAMDRRFLKSRGWATAEMSTAAEAQAAIDGAHDQEFQGRQLVLRLDSHVATELAAGDGATDQDVESTTDGATDQAVESTTDAVEDVVADAAADAEAVDEDDAVVEDEDANDQKEVEPAE